MMSSLSLFLTFLLLFLNNLLDDFFHDFDGLLLHDLPDDLFGDWLGAMVMILQVVIKHLPRGAIDKLIVTNTEVVIGAVRGPLLVNLAALCFFISLMFLIASCGSKAGQWFVEVRHFEVATKAMMLLILP